MNNINFNGFVQLTNSKTEKRSNPINTANILGFNSSVSRKSSGTDKYYTNTVSYINEQGNVDKLEVAHPSVSREYGEYPYGENFNTVFAKACAEADKTGEILSILV